MRSNGSIWLAGILAIGLLSGSALAQQAERPDRVAGKPNLNGIWQALNSANWNLEAHGAEALADFWQLGAIGAVPAGQSVVVGGSIPYLPQALAEREANRAAWPAADPEARCYMPGIPRAAYLPYPFQVIQGDQNILFVYEFAAANRIVRMGEATEPPIDSWMGWSNGRWDGDTLVIEVSGLNGQSWLDRAGNYLSYNARVTERYTPVGPDMIRYEATIEDPTLFSRPWQISMPLYRRVEADARLLEFKCVTFSERIIYGR